MNSLFLNIKTPFLISLAFLLCSLKLIAQSTPIGGRYGSNSNGTNNSSTTPPSDSVQQDVELDTATVNYYFADAPKVIYSEQDSLLNNYFHQYDPTRIRQLDYFNLGQAGTAATPSVYQPLFRRDLDIGLHAFDVYAIKNADIKFYQQTKAFTDAYYSAAAQTDNFQRIRFGRNFANGVNLSIDYKRINNTTVISPPQFQKRLFGGSGVTYDPARGRVVALGLGISVNRERYDGFFTFTSNIVNQLDKGGLDSTQVPTETNEFQLRNAFLTDAVTRHEKYEYSYLHYFKLNRKDSTGAKRSYLASHQLTYRDSKYQSSDPFLSGSISAPRHQDSLFYGTFLTDIRGIRFALRDKMLENTFNLSTTRQRKTTDSTHKVTAQNDWFEVGLIHAFHNVNQEIGAKNIQNLILKGRWNYTPNDNIRLETYTHFNILGYNLGDYRLSGELFLNLKNIGNLTVKAISQLYEPTYLQDELVLTQKPFWTDKNFKKTLETNLSGTIAIPRLGFNATAAYTLLNNYVYYDDSALVKQTSTPLSILQLIVNQNFKFGSFHSDNTLAFQKPTENVIRLPAFYTKNSLYWEGKLFKKVMLTRIGFDLRFASKWYAPNYMPITGQFFQQNITTVGEYPAVDVFLSFKVKHLRLFAKMENIVGGYANNSFYQTFNMPTPEAQFRFGMRWQLLN